MSHRRHNLVALVLLGLALSVHGQNQPHIGYIYPAGGRAGATFQAVAGGQFLGAVTNAFVSGDDVEVRVLEYNRPLGQKEFNDLRDRLRALQEQQQAARKSPNSTNTWTAADEKEAATIRARILKNPPNRQGNPALAETVTLRIAVGTNVAPGQREIRLATPNGLSNPLALQIGELPEVSEPPAKSPNPEVEKYLERLGRKPELTKTEARISLPATVNGQIMPGAVDRYRFSASAGQRIVVAVSARALIPYIPDAVPGWFQATVALFDDKGRELAYADDFRFNPDPVLVYEIPRDDDYVLEIRDSIYRGREDFIYRMSLGELPFATGLFPLGGPAGQATPVKFRGVNLAATNGTQSVNFAAPGVYELCTTNAGRVSNPLPFAVDTLPEAMETEPNDAPATAQTVTLPVILNGRIARPGDVDVFRFAGRAGDEVVAEVRARRLNSPLDSCLRLTDASGKQIAFNDDNEDKGAGMETHHADSYLRATLPADGNYFVHLGDTQHQGGEEYAYRLRLSAPQPDFALRVVPASASVRAGGSVPLTVFALRQDGFTNAITLELAEPTDGFTLSGARIAAGEDKTRLTLAAPPTMPPGALALGLRGTAIIAGRAVQHAAVPAEDMMQAFLYRHLVPAQEFTVLVGGRAMPPVKIRSPQPVKIPVNGTVRVGVGPLPPKMLENLKLVLADAPAGIALQGVIPVRDGAELELVATNATPGLRGNLIVQALNHKPAKRAKKTANQRPAVVGALPAISFVVVAPEAP